MRPTRLLVLTAFLLATPALALDITTPGQTVPKGELGVLQADLMCSPPSVGVRLENGARLNLNGHVLDGCTVAAASGSQTEPQRITVRGPGEIRNASYGISLRAGTLRVLDVAIHDSAYSGIIGSGDSQDGPSTARLTNVTVTGSGDAGIQATNVVARNVTASGNGVIGLPGNGIIGWGGVVGRDLAVTGNAGEGVYSAGRLWLRNSQVTGNMLDGLISASVTIIGSTVTGNNIVASPVGADVVSALPPRVRNSTCGTSLDSNSLQTWAVCSGD